MKKIITNKKGLWKIVMLTILCLLLFGVILLGSIKKVEVVGCSYYSEKEIEEKVMNSALTRNCYGLYFVYATGHGESIPFVEKISVDITGVRAVRIVVSEKTIVGCIKYMGEYLYFDKDGVVVESSGEKQEGIPLIEGVNFTKMNLREKLEVAEKDEDIFERIMGVSQLLSKYEISTDKVLFDSDRKVILYADHIRIKLGKRDMYDDQIAELSKLLPKAKKKKLKGVLDMENFEQGQQNIIFKKDE